MRVAFSFAMKHCIKILLGAFAIILFASCDPAQESNFKIVNKSSGSLTIQSFGWEDQENVVAPEYTLGILYHWELDCARSPEAHYAEFQQRFDSIAVSNELGESSTLDLFDISNWFFYRHGSAECNGTFEIEISDDDF